MSDVLANLGGVETSGQPNLSFDIVDNPDTIELKRLGFSFKLTHQVSLAHGGMARTDWRIPALKTAAYLGGQEDLTWLRPDGRTVRFHKTNAGLSRGSDGSTALVSSDGNNVEIITTRAVRWLFKAGFVESVQAGVNAYHFKTDRETILAIIKGEGASCSPKTGEQDTPATMPDSVPLLVIQYSDAGQLEGFAFHNGEKCTFQWTPDGCLQRVYGDESRQIDFEYDNRLLKSYHIDEGPSWELKWQPFSSMLRLALGRPPVMLGEDSSYHYRWKRKESLVILNIYRKSGEWISRTSFSAKGIIQQTTHEILQHAFTKT